MPFFPEEERDIVSNSLQKLNQNTNITQLSPGGKARFFLSTVAKEQAKQQQQFDENLLQPFIKYAKGKMLDFFGDMLNLPRVEASHAESTGNNFMFYVESGTFGDINAGATFQIPAGQRVYTEPFDGEIITPGLESQPIVTYTTIAPVTCDASQSYVYAAVRATVEGDESSIPRNTLTNHDFSEYQFVAQDLLKCTNRFSIDNGVSRENDDSYRYRLANIHSARNQGMSASIRLAALSVSGVADVHIVTSEQGPGTFAVYITGLTPTVSPTLIASVSESIAQVTSEGNRAFVSGPSPLGIELVVAVHWLPNASEEDINQGYAAMRSEAENRINNLDRGESLDLKELLDSLLRSAPSAGRIGRNEANTFEEVYLYRALPSGSGTVRTLHLGETVEALYNQRIILETSTRYRGIQFIAF